jgi:CheY-like chemotaxis protein
MPPVLVYTARALSKAEVQRLEAYADAVVLKEGPAAERLINEVRLFARRLAEGRPAKRKLSAVAATALMRLEGHKILIADDDMRTVYALSALLRARGAEVVVADTGLAALNVLSEQPDVDLVLMDIMMPEMDGFEAMRRLRKEARFHELPVIALTAKAMRVDREQCMQAGATDYLAKPIEADRLLGMVHARLSSEAPHAAG